jgi:hypothetical protein
MKEFLLNYGQLLLALVFTVPAALDLLPTWALWAWGFAAGFNFGLWWMNRRAEKHYVRDLEELRRAVALLKHTSESSGRLVEKLLWENTWLRAQLGVAKLPEKPGWN